MCNLYATMKMRAEVARFARALRDRNNNQPPMSGVYPDYMAPVIINTPAGREMLDMRWGLPSPRKVLVEAASKRADKLRAKGEGVGDSRFAEMVRMEPDRGVTNVRNTSSTHWKSWLGPEHRCLVPFTSFSEPDQVGGSLKPVWFALDDSRPVAFFAGIYVPNWKCVRKVREGEVTCDLFGFLTTDAAEPVKAYHSKAMPAILTRENDRDLWLSDAPWAEVAHLQHPCSDGALKVVGVGEKTDEIIPQLR